MAKIRYYNEELREKFWLSFFAILSMPDYKVINERNIQTETNVLLHPGEILKDELEAREISQKHFATVPGIQPQHSNDLLKGKRHISARLAVKIEKALGIDAAYWPSVQVAYDLAIARKEFTEV